jgi:hypothetical protein
MHPVCQDSWLLESLIPNPIRLCAPGVLQFGKTRRKRYALDFRYPISPLQVGIISM